MTAMDSVRVVLAEDNALLRQGVEKLIAQQDGLELVGTAGDLPGLLALWVGVMIIHSLSTARREVALEDPASGGWFTRSLKPGDKVVTRGAQMLLSEEFKSQIRVEDDDN